MNFRYTILTSVGGLLLLAMIGCERSGNVPVRRTLPPAPPAPAPKTDDGNRHYEQLLRKRLEFQAKIFEAMELYRNTSQKVYDQRAQLRRYLGNKSVSETIELFSKGRANEIPPDLRVAHSCWKTLIPDETQRLQIAAWLDKQQSSGILEKLDVQIKETENRRQLGKILDQEELAEIDRLLAQQVVGWEVVDIANKAVLEQEAIEKLKTELINWERAK